MKKLKDIATLVDMVRIAREEYEEAANGGVKSPRELQEVEYALEVLGADQSKFTLVHYEELNPETPLSEVYWDAFEKRALNKDVYVFYENYNNNVLYIPDTKTLCVMCEARNERDEAVFVVGMFESDVPITPSHSPHSLA